MWYLNDNLTTGIPSIIGIPTLTAVTINVTWTGPSSDKIASCWTIEGVDQTTPIANQNDTNSAFNTSEGNITMNLTEDANTMSVLSCHHGNPITGGDTLNITQGTNTALQTTAQGAMIDTVRQGPPVGTNTYNCNSNDNWRRVFVGVNINGD
jgi:hypothetical protein